MLDPRFKTFCFMSSLIGHEWKNMITNLCFLCFLCVIIICILWLNIKRDIVDERVEEDNSLDIFEMTTNVSEPQQN
jgi:hypothetical protein